MKKIVAAWIYHKPHVQVSGTWLIHGADHTYQHHLSIHYTVMKKQLICVLQLILYICCLFKLKYVICSFAILISDYTYHTCTNTAHGFSWMMLNHISVIHIILDNEGVWVTWHHPSGPVVLPCLPNYTSNGHTWMALFFNRLDCLNNIIAFKPIINLYIVICWYYTWYLLLPVHLWSNKYFSLLLSFHCHCYRDLIYPSIIQLFCSWWFSIFILTKLYHITSPLYPIRSISQYKSLLPC